MIPAADILDMTPLEWSSHVAAAQRHRAEERAWEAQLHGLKDRRGRRLTAKDFMPKQPNRKLTPEQIMNAFRTAFATGKN